MGEIKIESMYGYNSKGDLEFCITVNRFDTYTKYVRFLGEPTDENLYDIFRVLADTIKGGIK